jgi:cytochrome b pre-mRNA-processing protein 3
MIPGKNDGAGLARMATTKQPPRRRLAHGLGVWSRWRARRDGRIARRRAADGLYRALVDHARTPAFFRELGVPDTPEGRFEMIALHVALVVRRLRREGARGQALGHELFDLMFADMDTSLRELGVGDLSVGRYVRRLARNFYARLAALDESLASGDLVRLRGMIERNVFHGAASPAARQLDALGAWLVEQDRGLARQDGARLLCGEIALVEPNPHIA